jgi:lipoprotein NlpI
MRGDAYDDKGDHDRAFLDYNEAIRLNPNDSGVYYDRAVTYKRKGDIDHAIQDYDQAIRLNPKYAAAIYNRGIAYENKGAYDRAIQDYDQAIALNSSDASAFFRRGLAQFYLGRNELAQKDFAVAVQLRPKDAYTNIWSYVTQARAGNTGSSELQKNAAALDLKQWPGKIIELYLGTAELESVLAAAKNPDSATEKNQLCEAYFYLAERALIGGKPLDASALFQKALDTGQTTKYEYSAATEELRRLKSSSNH